MKFDVPSLPRAKDFKTEVELNEGETTGKQRKQIPLLPGYMHKFTQRKCGVLIESSSKCFFISLFLCFQQKKKPQNAEGAFTNFFFEFFELLLVSSCKDVIAKLK